MKIISSITLPSLLLLSVFLLYKPVQVIAQKNIADSTISMHLVQGYYATQIPGGDVSKRFGWNSMVGPAYLYKTNRNWLWGIEGGFMFGDQVKNSNNILENIETSDGNIVDLEGTYADYRFFERGYSILARTGKLLPLGPNTNSGVALGIGGGYIQHKIYIEHPDKTAPQITGDYTKGYDELKQGPAVNFFAGYIFLGNTKVINFYAGIDYTLAFTTHVRPYSFVRQTYNSGNFTDSFLGVKVGWFIPIYKRAPKEYYFY